MKNSRAILLALLSIATCPTLSAQEEIEPASSMQAPVQPETSATSDVDEPEAVLVTGEQPGPGLWKVSRDGHVMWVLGSIGLVPGTISWRTKEVEAAIAQSQEVLYPGGARVGVDIGILEGITLLPSALKAAKNPNGATLKDVLSPEIHAKWLALKQQYIGDDKGIEKYRPDFAQERLMEAIARKHRSPTRPTNIRVVVNKLAKKHKVKVRALDVVERKIEIANPRAILKAVQKVDFAEGDCFGRNIERIQQAVDQGLFSDVTDDNAWAKGDLETLRKQPAAGLGLEDCMMAMLNAAINDPDADLPADVVRGVDIMKQQSDLLALATDEVERNWLEAAQAALAKNTSTFAVLPIRSALSPTRYLAKLRESGYVVEEPQ